MKVHVTENINQAMNGFRLVPIVYGKLDLGRIPDNAATEIIAIDALESIAYSQVGEFFKNIRAKMRMGCTITVGGVDLSLLARGIINGSVNSLSFNDQIYKTKGIYQICDIQKLISDNGLIVDHVSIAGLSYTIKASRPTQKQ